PPFCTLNIGPKATPTQNQTSDRNWGAYGDDIAGDIELVLRMIRAGNLTDNTWDYLLYHVSFGRWGL
ncbi:MAG: hypothetical protein U9R15_15945, partial [Chloroflexota bacterium]|nr:hypothetical protein [Chloroflexota bacterium]